VTGGTHAGVMKYVGEAVRNHTIACGNKKPIATIGIAVWGCISNRELLVRPSNKVRTPNHGDIQMSGVHLPKATCNIWLAKCGQRMWSE